MPSRKPGEIIPSEDVVGFLLSVDPACKHPDGGYQEFIGEFSSGKNLEYVIYSPRLQAYGDPGFVLALSGNGQDPVLFEVAYGSKIRDFVLNRVNDVYYGEKKDEP